MNKFITPGLALVGVLIGYLVQKSTDDKTDYINTITNERQCWREEIRNLTKELNAEKANYKELKVEFQVRLNPYVEDEDNEIIKCFNKLVKNESFKSFLKEKRKDELLEEINKRIALLLKHDWERVKLESNRNVFFPYGAIAFIILNISILILIHIRKELFRTDILEFFKSLISVNVVSNILILIFTFIFITSWSLIIWRIIESKSLIKDSILDKLYNFFKIPKRRKYEDNQENEENK